MKQFYLLIAFLIMGISHTHAEIINYTKINGIYYSFNTNTKEATVTCKAVERTRKTSWGLGYDYTYITADYWGNITIPNIVMSGGIPYKVTGIATFAFGGCTGLKSVSIPYSVTEIGTSAFSGCTDLENVYSYIGDPFQISDGVFTTYDKTILHVISGTKALYEQISCWNKFNNIQESITNYCEKESIYYKLSEDEGTAIVIGSTIKQKDNDIIIPESINNCDKEYSVTSIGSSAFTGCTDLTSITIPNSVTTIGNNAFYGCTGLASITIPNSVTTIEGYSFRGCTGLTSIEIPNSVTSIEDKAFEGCTGLMSITIPESITEIKSNAFSTCDSLKKVITPNLSKWCEITFADKWSNPLYYAHHLYTDENTEITELTIPEDVSNIKAYAFEGLGIKNLIIPNTVTGISNYAFYGCDSLSLVTINSNEVMAKYRYNGNGLYDTLPFIFGNQVKKYVIGEGVTSIGGQAFYGCEMLEISLPESLSEIKEGAFKECANLNSIELPDMITWIGYSWGSYSFGSVFDYYTNVYVTRGSRTLLSVWEGSGVPFDKETRTRLYRPTLKLAEHTQTTITMEIDNLYEEYGYKVYEDYNRTKTIPLTDNKAKITNLFPQSGYSFYLSATLGYTTVEMGGSNLSTANISPVVNATPTATSLTIRGSYIAGDAIVTDQVLTVGNETANGNAALISGLDPNDSHKAKYIITVKNDSTGTETKTYTAESSFRTEELKLTTLQPKVVSVGNVIVAAESNIDDAETNVGFEWRRKDWTDDFESNKGGAYLFDGMMEGYIRNLNAEKLWMYRPYYTSNSGKSYYGDWVGLDPANTSYFEPTVHTYAKISVEGNAAEVKGYVMRGSDNVAQQGFKYWKANTAASRSGEQRAPSIPKDAMTVEAEGTVMTAELKDLDFETEYCVVAFVKTSENETFYGEQQTFQTGIDTSGVEEVMATPTDATEVSRYDLKGRRLDAPQKGLNIIRMSDGTVRKVMVK